MRVRSLKCEQYILWFRSEVCWSSYLGVFRTEYTSIPCRGNKYNKLNIRLPSQGLLADRTPAKTTYQQKYSVFTLRDEIVHSIVVVPSQSAAQSCQLSYAAQALTRPLNMVQACYRIPLPQPPGPPYCVYKYIHKTRKGNDAKLNA